MNKSYFHTQTINTSCVQKPTRYLYHNLEQRIVWSQTYKNWTYESSSKDFYTEDC